MNIRSACVMMMIMFISFSMTSNIIDQKENSAETLVADPDKWHPEFINIIHPEMSVEFILPYEKEQSGVFNLLFQCKKTGEIHLIDTIKENKRYFNSLLVSEKFDAILLYNNGEYIRHKDVFFEKNASTEVDMGKGDVHPPDSASLRWLTSLRTFSAAIKERRSATSGGKNRGYVFNYIDYHDKGTTTYPDAVIEGENEYAISSIDGYFDINVASYPAYLTFGFPGYQIRKINLKANSGIVLLMEKVQSTISDDVIVGVPRAVPKIK